MILINVRGLIYDLARQPARINTDRGHPGKRDWVRYYIPYEEEDLLGRPLGKILVFHLEITGIRDGNASGIRCVELVLKNDLISPGTRINRCRKSRWTHFSEPHVVTPSRVEEVRSVGKRYTKDDQEEQPVLHTRIGQAVSQHLGAERRS